MFFKDDGPESEAEKQQRRLTILAVERIAKEHPEWTWDKVTEEARKQVRWLTGY